jgi:hypothetical protein
VEYCGQYCDTHERWDYVPIEFLLYPLDAHLLQSGDAQIEQQTTTTNRDNVAFGAPFAANMATVTIGIRYNMRDHGACVTSAVAL